MSDPAASLAPSDVVVILRDRETRGVNFLLWGFDWFRATQSLSELVREGFDAADFEIIAIRWDLADVRTREIIAGR